MNVSERLIYLLLEYLKDYNAKIRYDRGRKTYYYVDEFDLDIRISVAVINNDERTEIFGAGYWNTLLLDNILNYLKILLFTN